MAPEFDSSKYLTKDQVRAACPLAFASAPTNPKLSDKYVHANSETIVDDLEKLGWLPVQASQRKARKSDKATIFSKHMVVFQKHDLMIKGKNGDNVYPRIIMTNSHDGMNSFQFRVGLYRLVCSNGLVIADQEFNSFRIKHKGYTFEELRGIVNTTISDIPNKVEILNRMKDRLLTKEEQRELALKALQVRAGEEKLYDDETLMEVLEPVRDSDKGDDLWTIFNVIQEKVTQGGFGVALKGAKVRKLRKIKSFEKDLDVNQKLFKLATSLLPAEEKVAELETA